MQIAARDHNKIYTGTMTVPVAKPIFLIGDLTQVLKVDGQSGQSRDSCLLYRAVRREDPRSA